MNNILNFMGIFPNEIEHANGICQKVLEHAGTTEDEMKHLYDGIHYEFYNCMDYTEFFNITNAFIFALFSNVKLFIKKRYPELDVDIYVNGIGSIMIIDGMKAEEYGFLINE